MGTPTAILLVEDNAGHARQIVRAFGDRALPSPMHLRKGEEAVMWVSGNRCDVCLLDYDLPGIDGIETLLRLHQRRPNLPVIMLSDARSERAAVAAFHAGVVDYVPKVRGFEDAVVEMVERLVLERAAAQPAPQLIAAGVPDELVQPTYQNRLRVIGRQLDLYRYHSINISEVGGGFLVRALAAGGRVPEALEFPDRDFAQSVMNAIAARGEKEHPRTITPLLPTGYEDFLRALGYHLDRRVAEAVTITELDGFIAVGGVAKAEGIGHTTIEPFQQLLRHDEIAYLLDQAFRRRQKKAGLSFTRVLNR